MLERKKAKYEKRTGLFNVQIISMYLFDMSTRDIQGHLQHVYGVEVSSETISNITASEMEDMEKYVVRKSWINRLDLRYR